ncbi:MAG: multicopper oxidase domain-containing protein [Nocardioidaceae bacterium]
MSAGNRGFQPLRDVPVVGWLVAAVVVAVLHPFVPAPRWLMIHLLLLGAAGHAIVVWSRYFAETLLRLPTDTRSRRGQFIRLALYNAGVLLVVVGMVGDIWPVTVVGASGLAVAVGWHGASLAFGMRRALSSRFAPSIRYYVAAAGLLPVGAGLGVWMACGISDPLHEQVLVAHISLNLLGWMGLTVLGTMVTLWPTMLRTRIADGAERAARRALPVLVASILVSVSAGLLGLRPGVALGLIGYLAGIGVLAVPGWKAARGKPPTSFPAWSVLAGVGWLTGCLAALAVGIATADSWASVEQRLGVLTPYLAAGFAAQVLLGALSYLLPVVLGGGPAPVRAANRALDSGGALRVMVVNLGLLVCVLPVPSLVRVLTSMLVLVALAAFIPLLFVGIRASRRTRIGLDEAGHMSAEPGRGPRDPSGERPRGQRAGLAVTGVSLIVLAVAVGGALDPAALQRTTASAAAGVVPTGETTRVVVEAADMRFSPDRIRLPAGNRLVIVLRDTDDSDVHDLVLETGHDSGRISPGEEATLDVGVVGRDLDGWCSVVGHRQMGMTLTVEVSGRDPAADLAPGTTNGHDAMQHAGPRGGADVGGNSAADDFHPMAKPGPGFVARDAGLPAHVSGHIHRRTFTVSELEAAVAPRVRQRLWTYNGTAPGPVLHGKVGDVFEITLVNDGTIGHSIDFHAGALAPDAPMSTIAPGESLVYRFRATRAGIWMYHCSTMPMSAHIASGLFGAVVIDPPDLPQVDRSYVLVQSELYLGPQGGQVDVKKVSAERPDAVVFNGYANQYDHRPLIARVGERVRIWVLDAGPSRPSSFHVVGGQFDTVYAEGAYLLGGPAGPAQSGGAQSLALAPAQGGFVELTFPAPGHYPFVSHVMVDAERGAHGIVRVVP